jgi:hypothetical protein
MGIRANFGAGDGTEDECGVSCAGKAVLGNRKTPVTRQAATQEPKVEIKNRFRKYENRNTGFTSQ